MDGQVALIFQLSFNPWVFFASYLRLMTLVFIAEKKYLAPEPI
jgi:hypothetical protein